MAKVKDLTQGLSDVNLIPKNDGTYEVVVSVSMPPIVEGASVAIAFDGSRSMMNAYGVGGTVFQAVPNQVQPVARVTGKHLLTIDADGKVDMIYWAAGAEGGEIEVIGTFDEAGCDSLVMKGPKKWGTGTKLLPPLKYFVDEKFVNEPFAMIVFITDGVIDDLQAVKDFCMDFGKKISDGKRKFFKLLLLGVGSEIDEKQMNELDNMFEGTNLKTPSGDIIDLWAHKNAVDMKSMDEVFAELVSENTFVAPSAKILSASGNEIASFSDGLPAKFRFNMPKTENSFTVKFSEGELTQDITSGKE